MYRVRQILSRIGEESEAGEPRVKAWKRERDIWGNTERRKEVQWEEYIEKRQNKNQLKMQTLQKYKIPWQCGFHWHNLKNLPADT